jgi:hypothetical protein
MKRNSDNTVNRKNWPTLEEIEKYVPAGTGGSFEVRCKHALRELHALADVLDAQVSAGGLPARCAELEKALSYYADECRYRWWGEDRQHWLFEPLTWGGIHFHQEPRKDANERPWALAHDALFKKKTHEYNLYTNDSTWGEHNVPK